MGRGFNFRLAASEALGDESLQLALGVMKSGFVDKRAKARSRLPEFDILRERGASIRSHVLENLDSYLLHYESRVLANGGQVHWARDGSSACRQVLEICGRHGAKLVTKGKSMIGEEIGINGALSSAGIVPLETDLGEYIIQLRDERPSHIIAPALHVLKDEVAASFRVHHDGLCSGRILARNQDLVKEARHILRGEYLRADVGITGANFLLADSGASVLVTNEGNGDLTSLLPRVHIVLASIEKLVPNMHDVFVLLRLLSRSATGQDLSTYTSFSTGVRRVGELDGADEYHVILLDNGRSDLLGSSKSSILGCIRCGACMNHCPVYGSIGGHAYGGIYPGPLGAALSPGLGGLSGGSASDLPYASSFCGRCDSVCPVGIPLTSIMREWRFDDFISGTGYFGRLLLRVWLFFVLRPFLYRFFVSLSLRLFWVLGYLPFMRGWLSYRFLPFPESRSSFLRDYIKSHK